MTDRLIDQTVGRWTWCNICMSMSPGVQVATMVTPRWWAEPVFAASVMVTWTSVKRDTVTPSLGSVSVALATQPGDTVKSVGLVTMEMLWLLRTVKVRGLFSLLFGQ